MSGQNSDGKRESQFGNLVKMSANVLSYDMCQTKHHLTPLLTDLLKLPWTSLKVADSENSYTLCKLRSKKKKRLSLKCHEAAFNDIAGALIQSSLQLEVQAGAQSLALLTASGVKPVMFSF